MKYEDGGAEEYSEEEIPAMLRKPGKPSILRAMAAARCEVAEDGSKIFSRQWHKALPRKATYIKQLCKASRVK